MYSQQLQDFQSVPHAVKVYKFAHQMQIECLLIALDHFFKGVQVADRFLIFDLYKMLDVQLGLESCKKVIGFFSF